MKPPPSARLIRGHRLAQGLVGTWTMVANGGLQAFDLSGYGNTGVIDTGAIWVPGQFGSVLDYDGTNNAQVTISSSPTFLEMPALTISIWAKYEGSERADEYNLVDAWAGADMFHYLLRFDDGAAVNAIEFFTFTSGQVGGAFTGTDMSDGLWHHIVAVYDGAKMYIYFDSVKSSTSFAQTGSIGAINPSDLKIGGQVAIAADFWNGKLDIPSIYNRGLSASEIASLYWKPFCMFEREARTALLNGYAVPPVGNAGIMTTNTGFWGPTF